MTDKTEPKTTLIYDEEAIVEVVRLSAELRLNRPVPKEALTYRFPIVSGARIEVDTTKCGHWGDWRKEWSAKEEKDPYAGPPEWRNAPDFPSTALPEIYWDHISSKWRIRGSDKEVDLKISAAVLADVGGDRAQDTRIDDRQPARHTAGERKPPHGVTASGSEFPGTAVPQSHVHHWNMQKSNSSDGS